MTSCHSSCGVVWCGVGVKRQARAGVEFKTRAAAWQPRLLLWPCVPAAAGAAAAAVLHSCGCCWRNDGSTATPAHTHGGCAVQYMFATPFAAPGNHQGRFLHGLSARQHLSTRAHLLAPVALHQLSRTLGLWALLHQRGPRALVAGRQGCQPVLHALLVRCEHLRVQRATHNTAGRVERWWQLRRLTELAAAPPTDAAPAAAAAAAAPPSSWTITHLSCCSWQQHQPGCLAGCIASPRVGQQRPLLLLLSSSRWLRAPQSCCQAQAWPRAAAQVQAWPHLLMLARQRLELLHQGDLAMERLGLHGC
jgi:hypothetical protein